MNVFLYFRTYWGDPSGPGMSGRNILASNKYDLVKTCIQSLELFRDLNIHTCACVDNSTPEYTKFLERHFDEVLHTNEGFDVDDHKGIFPVFGGMGNLIKVLNHINSKMHDDDDIILLLEDDYLFAPNGFRDWISACSALKGFVSPFDHPDRYYRNDDWFFKKTPISLHDNRHFRNVESTTSVVGGRYRYFRKTHFLRKIPRFHIWFFWPERIFGGELPSIDRVFYRRAFLFLRIRLFSPIPGFATHLSAFVPPTNSDNSQNKRFPSTQLSPNYDWEQRFYDILDKDKRIG